MVDKKGIIAWIGHPMQLKDEAIQEVLAGKFDLQKAAADYAVRAKQQEEMAKNQQQIMRFSGQLSNALKGKNWDDAESALGQIEKLLPEEQRSGICIARLNILLSKGDTQAASKLAGQVSDSHQDNAMVQNGLAWEMLTHKDVKDRNLGLAHKNRCARQRRRPGQRPRHPRYPRPRPLHAGQKGPGHRTPGKGRRARSGRPTRNVRKTLASYKEGKLPEPAE